MAVRSGGTWTQAESRERAAYVLGVPPDASPEAAARRYRDQLLLLDGDTEHGRTARRALMSAWAVWNGVGFDPVVVRSSGVDVVDVARAEREAALAAEQDPVMRVVDVTDAAMAVPEPASADPDPGLDPGPDPGPATGDGSAGSLAVSVEVVEVTRDHDWPRLRHEVRRPDPVPARVIDLRDVAELYGGSARPRLRGAPSVDRRG